MDSIFIKGARTHNLKNVDLEIPRDKIIVITGLLDQGSHRLLLIPYMQKVKEDMLNHYQPMQEDSCQ